MSKINHQIQRIAERFKSYENKYELKEDIQVLLAELREEERIIEIKPQTIGDIVTKRMLQLENPELAYEMIIKTDFTDYDEQFGGLIKGELVVIGGRPGMGKSQFMINLCTNIASLGKPCGFLSLEMSTFLLANRFISNISRVSQQDIAFNEFTGQREIDINRAVNVLNTMPIYIRDQYINTLTSVTEGCRQLVNENEVQVIFIDYLQLIGNYNRRQSRESELAYITRELKRLAMELNISIVTTSQLSRSVENRPGGSRRPQLSDLRESGAIEQDADRVIFLYRPEYYGMEVDENNEPTRGLVEVIVAKNKTGNCGTFKLKAEQNFSAFKKYNGGYSDLEIKQSRLNELNTDPPF